MTRTENAARRSIVFDSLGGMNYLDDGECGRYYAGHIGIDMFHGHLAALAVARRHNRRAGRKVKRVIVAKQHFMVVAR